MKRYAPLFIFLTLAVLLAYGLSLTATHRAPVDPMVGKAFPELPLPVMGKEDAQFDLKALRGRRFLVSLFASWCEGCLAEHQLLLSLQQIGVAEIYGIAWKDKPKDTEAWLTKHGNPYHDVILDPEGQAAVLLGSTGVPETYLVEPTGIISAVYRGELTPEIIQTKFLPVLNGKQP